MAGTDVGTIAALEGIIGKTPPAINLKVIDHLDEGARGAGHGIWGKRSFALY